MGVTQREKAKIISCLMLFEQSSFLLPVECQIGDATLTKMPGDLVDILAWQIRQQQDQEEHKKDNKEIG